MPQAFSDSIVAALPDAVITIDRTSTILDVNEAAMRLFGYPREAFVGRTLAETIIPADLASQHARGMEKHAATGHGPVIGRRVEITARDRSDRRFPIELCVFVNPERPREIFHATIRETSDRVARDAVVTAERERLKQILDATADAWWDCAVLGETRYSGSATHLLAASDAALHATNPASLPSIHEDDRQRVADAWAAHLEGTVARFECTHRVVGDDGSIRWLRQRGRAVEFNAGRPARIVGTIADVTEQQAAEEGLRNAQRLEMLGLLAGGFAHDLNNMLAAIRGHAALAATEPGIVPAALESLAAIQLATTKAKMLTRNMLSLGRPSRESIVRFPLRSAVEEALELVRPSLPKTIAVSADLAQVDGIEVEMDPSAFQQAVLNLVINARDAMPSGGRLRVSATPSASDGSGESVQILVEDTGCGIAPDVLAHVFEPFFTTKPRGVGTGLGLSVVQQVVASAHGTVKVQSDVGRGTRFTIALPASRVPQAWGEQPSRRAAPQVIVLAEAHEILRPMLCEALRAEGHTVIEAPTSDDALRHATDPRLGVTMLVAEVGLAPVGGPQVHVQIEAVRGSALPAVFMSASPAFALPLSDRRDITLLQKPFEIVDLVTALADCTLGRA